jgi:hypothetical protein
MARDTKCDDCRWTRRVSGSGLIRSARGTARRTMALTGTATGAHDVRRTRGRRVSHTSIDRTLKTSAAGATAGISAKATTASSNASARQRQRRQQRGHDHYSCVLPSDTRFAPRHSDDLDGRTAVWGERQPRELDWNTSRHFDSTCALGQRQLRCAVPQDVQAFLPKLSNGCNRRKTNSVTQFAIPKNRPFGLSLTNETIVLTVLLFPPFRIEGLSMQS